MVLINRSRRATLQAVFRSPTPATIRWEDIESLVRALGGDVISREGSRVAFVLGGVRAVFHRPHPRPETGRKTVRDVRDFLQRAGVTP